MPAGAGRLGFRFLQSTAGRLDCSIFPVYIPLPENNYNPISNLGSIVSSQTISNSFVFGRINSQGAFSSIKFDPNGTSNYGGEDFVEPGFPWEGYSFNVFGRGVIGGGNALSPSNLSTTVRNIESNYIATITGNTSIGHLITQTKIIESEPLIRMQMSYTNTTGSSVLVKAMRALDPDQGIGQGLGFATQNFRGFGAISKNDIVFAFSGTEGIAVYVPGNGYTHNTGIVSSWPSFNPDLYLTETSNITADWAVGGAWNFGTILPNSTVTVCCYYIFGRTVNEILPRIVL
jgi:hypothetical protein